jgi:dihydrolipoamide dehydrogenase
MEQRYDLAIIGAGPGGYVAAIRAAQLGLKTVCIDKRGIPGGTCLNVGCIPSKALLYSTEMYAWLSQNSKKHGLGIESVDVDFQAMMRRKETVVKGLVEGINHHFKRYNIDFLKGKARFLSPYRLEVKEENQNGQVIEASHFILATGAEPIQLPGLPFDERLIISSTGALSLSAIPKKLLVVGGGVIGVELASVYRRLGTDVVIIEMLDRICPPMDQTMSKLLLQVLKKQGMHFVLSTKVMGAEIANNRVALKLQQEAGELTESGDVALIAVGRRPYTADLDLEKIGISLTKGGFVPVDGRFRTIQPHIYAIGDVIEVVMLAHRASEEGVAVVELIAGKQTQVHYMAIPNVIYTSPEVASVGLTEQEAREAGLEMKIGLAPFKGNPRARCNEDTEGVVKVIGESRTGRVIGLHILGQHASELIAEGMLAIQKKATLEDLAEAPQAHPTLSESIKEASLAALGRAIHV